MAYGKQLFKVVFKDTYTYIVRAYTTKHAFEVLTANGIPIEYPLRISNLNGGLRMPEGVTRLDGIDLYHRRIRTPNKTLELYFPFDKDEIEKFDNTCCDLIECVAQNVTLIVDE